MDTNRVKDILLEALDRPAEERLTFLDSACGSDSELRARVDELLVAHGDAGEFLEQTPSRTADLDEAVQAHAGPKIGHYELLHAIGEGGFGTVYLARQREPVRRRVALKIIKLGMDTKQVIARFEAERQALALMDHPGITKVLDAGATETGRPYFVMEYVAGRPVTTYCDDEMLSIQSRLQLFQSICHAVQHAHQKGIIHRDIKPNNVLVTVRDGEPVAKVIDFGIAKAMGPRLMETTKLTLDRQIVGTPQYMSPEQASLSADLDTRSDVYSLGVLLYEMLVGASPFDESRLREAGLADLERIIHNEEPPKPSTRARSVVARNLDVARHRDIDAIRFPRELKGDLDWIVMRAMAKAPERRYPTAAALADDIGRYLQREPVEAGPPNTAYRVLKFYQRHRLMTFAAALMLLVLIAATVVSSGFAARAVRARDDAEALQTLAERRSYAANLYAAQAAISENDGVGARRYLENTPPALRGWEWRHLMSLVDQSMRVLQPTPEKGEALAVSPTGAIFATAWPDRTIRLLSTRDGREEIILTGHEAEVIVLRFAPDGQELFSGDRAGAIKVWDLDAVEPRLAWQAHDRQITRVAVSGDGTVILTASMDGVARTWDRATGQLLASFLDHLSPVRNAQLDASGARALTGGFDDRVRLWDARSGVQIAEHRTAKASTPDAPPSAFNPGRIVTFARSPAGDQVMVGNNDGALTLINLGDGSIERRYSGQNALVRNIAFSPDGSLFAVASHHDRVVRAWSVDAEQPVAVLMGHDDNLREVAFTPDGRALVSASWDNSIRLWSVSDWRFLCTLLGHDSGIHQLRVTADGSRLVTRAEAGDVRLWDLDAARRRAIAGHERLLFSVVFALGGTRVIAGETEGVARVWDLRNAQFVFPLDDDGGGVASLAISTDERMLASGGMDGQLTLWDAATGERLRTVSAHEGPIRAIDYLTDDKTIVTGGADGTIAVWDVASCKLRHRLDAHASSVRALAVDEHRRWIISGSEDGELRYWDLDTGGMVREMIEPGFGWIMALSISPDNQRLALGCDDRVIRLFDLDTGTVELAMPGHSDGVSDLEWMPDGSRLVSASGDRTVRLWDPTTGDLVGTLAGHTRQVRALSIGAEGRQIASAGEDGTIRIWTAPSETDLSPR